MPLYNLSGMVTISISGTVEADSAAEALEKAHELDMPDLCHSCTQTHDPEEALWDVDALDGSALEVTAEEGD